MKDLLTRRLLPFIQRCLVPPPWWRHFWWSEAIFCWRNGTVCQFLLLPLYHVIDHRYKRGEDQSLNELHTHFPIIGKWSLPFHITFFHISNLQAQITVPGQLVSKLPFGANMRLLTSLGSSVDEMCCTPASGGCPWCNENFFHPSSSFFCVHLCKKMELVSWMKGLLAEAVIVLKWLFCGAHNGKHERSNTESRQSKILNHFFFYVVALFHS